MMVSRRFFIGGTLALMAAPAIVKADSLMRIRPTVWLPADEAAARIVALMNARDESPEGRAELIWRANPGTQFCRAESNHLYGNSAMPPEFVAEVKRRIMLGYGYNA